MRIAVISSGAYSDYGLEALLLVPENRNPKDDLLALRAGNAFLEADGNWDGKRAVLQRLGDSLGVRYDGWPRSCDLAIKYLENLGYRRVCFWDATLQDSDFNVCFSEWQGEDERAPWRCEACRFWRRYKTGFGRVCVHPRVGSVPLSEDGAVVFGNTDYELLLTGPQYGCVHWQPGQINEGGD